MKKKITINDLKLDDKNFNKGTEEGKRLIKRSIKELGAGRSILIDKHGNVISGNKTLENYKELGLEEIEVIQTTGERLVIVQRKDLDLNSPEGRELALADNKTAEINLNWDFGQMSETLGNEVLESWMMDPEETDDFLENEEDDFEVNIDDTVKPISKIGDVYEIIKGKLKHKVMCQDIMETEFIKKHMDGQQVDLIVTDPPYNVAYEGGTKEKLKIENDDMSDGDFADFLFKSFSTMSEITKPGGGIYIFYASREAVNFITQMERSGFLHKQQLIWMKNTITLGRQDYQWQHEPCLYGWKAGGPHYFVDNRSLRTKIKDEKDLSKMTKKKLLEYIEEINATAESYSDVIRADKPARNAEHPTMKPLVLIGKLLKNSSQIGELVFDGFLGSGSTIMSGHQLNRNVYGVEYDPRFVDVIIRRIMKLDDQVTILRNGKEIDYNEFKTEE